FADQSTYDFMFYTIKKVAIIKFRRYDCIKNDFDKPRNMGKNNRPDQYDDLCIFIYVLISSAVKTEDPQEQLDGSWMDPLDHEFIMGPGTGKRMDTLYSLLLMW
ncbi:hypothetical protein ACJX0J_039483, partial [Zea mays]